MMKKNLLLFAFALLSITGFSQDKDWFEVYSDDDEVIEIHLSSIKRNGNAVKGWVKTTYLGRSHIDQRLQQLYEIGLEEYGGKWENWDHSMNYSEYNCDWCVLGYIRGT